jgi:hypothetical protein
VDAALLASMLQVEEAALCKCKVFPGRILQTKLLANGTNNSCSSKSRQTGARGPCMPSTEQTKSGGMSLSRNGLATAANSLRTCRMKVRVEVRAVELEIPCGDGDQVSWMNSNIVGSQNNYSCVLACLCACAALSVLL